MTIVCITNQNGGKREKMSNIANDTSMRLEVLEELVYGEVISAIRALPVSEMRKRPLVDAAMQILCDAEEEFAASGRDDAKLAAAARAARLRIATLEEEVAAIRDAG